MKVVTLDLESALQERGTITCGQYGYTVPAQEIVGHGVIIVSWSCLIYLPKELSN
jgi:hypothetical protein